MRQKAFFFNTLFPSLLFHFQCVFCYVFLSHLRNTSRKHNSEQNRHGFNIPLQSIMASSGRNEIKSFRIVSHRRKNPMTIFHGFFFEKMCRLCYGRSIGALCQCIMQCTAVDVTRVQNSLSVSVLGLPLFFFIIRELKK